MPTTKPTKAQRRLVTEVNQLLSMLTLNPEEIMTKVDPKTRTTRLERAKEQIIRGEVILFYVVMDEQLSMVTCWHFFGRKRKLEQQWRTKRFKSFNHFILERLYLIQKLEFVQSIHNIPKGIASDLKALNDLRNSIAHSFFPQKRRRKPEWKGQSIFTHDGFHRFVQDMGKLSSFFLAKFWTRSPS